MSVEKIDKSLYLEPIENLIKEFNEKWDSKFAQYGNVLPPNLHTQYQGEAEELIQALYKITETHLRDTYEEDAKNFRVLQLFRHGECTDSKKGFGFKPNANINSYAHENMNHFNYSALLYNKLPTQVVFSTMTRATTTAAHFIEGLQRGGIKIFSKSSPKLTEIAEGPSGFGIEEPSEYVSLIKPSSGVKPKHRVMLFFSFIAYSVFGSTLKTNENAKTTALATINNHSELVEQSTELHSSDVTHTSDAERGNGLALEIVEQINQGGAHDVVVVGHGNSIRDTLTTFFPNYAKEHRKKDALGFAEGQGLMTFDVNGEQQLFMLPFRVQVDQHTPGKMNIRYTSYAELSNYQQSAEQVMQKQREIDAYKSNAPSYGTMIEGGLIPGEQSEPSPNLDVAPSAIKKKVTSDSQLEFNIGVEQREYQAKI